MFHRLWACVWCLVAVVAACGAPRAAAQTDAASSAADLTLEDVGSRRNRTSHLGPRTAPRRLSRPHRRSPIVRPPRLSNRPTRQLCLPPRL